MCKSEKFTQSQWHRSDRKGAKPQSGFAKKFFSLPFGSRPCCAISQEKEGRKKKRNYSEPSERVLNRYKICRSKPLYFQKLKIMHKNLATECPFWVSAQPLSGIKVWYFMQFDNRPKSTALLTGKSYKQLSLHKSLWNRSFGAGTLPTIGSDDSKEIEKSGV